MRGMETITFVLPARVGRELEKTTRRENRTIAEWVEENLRREDALATYERVSAKIRTAVKKRGLTQRDFGGPFAE